MPRTDLYEYERRIRVILLEADADQWSLEHVAHMAVRSAQITLMNRQLSEGAVKRAFCELEASDVND